MCLVQFVALSKSMFLLFYLEQNYRCFHRNVIILHYISLKNLLQKHFVSLKDDH